MQILCIILCCILGFCLENKWSPASRWRSRIQGGHGYGCFCSLNTYASSNVEKQLTAYGSCPYFHRTKIHLKNHHICWNITKYTINNHKKRKKYHGVHSHHSPDSTSLVSPLCAGRWGPVQCPRVLLCHKVCQRLHAFHWKDDPHRHNSWGGSFQHTPAQLTVKLIRIWKQKSLLICYKYIIPFAQLINAVSTIKLKIGERF